MAKKQKETKIEEAITPEFDGEPIVSNEMELPNGNVLIYSDSDSELSFLKMLLDKQVSGRWHGPAASLIKERIAKLKGN